MQAQSPRPARSPEPVDARPGGAILNNRLSTISPVTGGGREAGPGWVIDGTGHRHRCLTEVAITESCWRIERMPRQVTPVG
jgi:hypothetical protein